MNSILCLGVIVVNTVVFYHGGSKKIKITEDCAYERGTALGLSDEEFRVFLASINPSSVELDFLSTPYPIIGIS
jgi:hypothetical protein